MRIGFIGAGRMGFTLGKYLKEHEAVCNADYDFIPEFTVAGYYSKTKEHAKEAAKFTDTLYYSNINDIICDCDTLILTVNDNLINSVYEELKQFDLQGKIICHTSGALSSEVFSESNDLGLYGYSIHPMYAVSDKLKSYKNFHNAFITIEGHPKYRAILQELFIAMGNKTAVIDKDCKPKYHAASVFASNFVCGIFSEAENLLVECGFDEALAHEAISGIFIDNARSIVENGTTKALTGPLERNDYKTIKRHLDVLDVDGISLYMELSKAVLKIAKKKNPERDYSKSEGMI